MPLKDRVRHLLHRDQNKDRGQSATGENEISQTPTFSVTKDDSAIEDEVDHDEKLPHELSLKIIESQRTELQKKLKSVTKKLSELVLENHTAYMGELQRVMDLQEDLERANVLCASGRKKLTLSREKFSGAGLGVLGKHRKKQLLSYLLQNFHTIKTLQKTDIHLRELLEEKLDVALSKICSKFDSETYTTIQNAYSLLGKNRAAMDQLHMHYTSAIHNTAFSVVTGHVEEKGEALIKEEAQKFSYQDLCKKVPISRFIECLIHLSKEMWYIMHSYYYVMKWHKDEEKNVPKLDSYPSIADIENDYNKKYVLKKLETGFTRVWQDVQMKVKLLLFGTDFSSFSKFEDLLFILDLTNRLMLVGEEFCGSKSKTLQETIRTQSINYFKSHHRARLDELRMYLENEAWEVCPLELGFNIFNLQEFRFLRTAVQDANKSKSDTNGMRCEVNGIFEKYNVLESPFDCIIEDNSPDDVVSTDKPSNDEPEVDEEGKTIYNDNDEDDIPDELKQDFIDEQTGETPSRNYKAGETNDVKFSQNSSVVANTTLTTIRFFGRYMHIMHALSPIAFDVLISMTQLFDYYLFTVFSFFSNETISNNHQLSSKLAATLKRIKDNMIQSSHASESVSVSVDDIKVQFPRMSLDATLFDAGTQRGLACRIIATESVIFLADKLELLRLHLETMIPSSKRPFLSQFYSQIRLAMNNVKWDVKEIMSQHSSYVDLLIQEFWRFDTYFKSLARRVLLPIEVYNILWDRCIKLANKTFVDGFSNVKKCSNEGRALMQLDFQQYLLQLEKMTTVRPIPEKEYVENYVKAYYLTESEIEKWIRSHKEYSSKHLSNLVLHGVGSHLNKKQKQKILNLIEDIEKGKKS
ncbi:uncharacterized protein TRIADDRAFT_54017 [Trichoplax adhaerens]|uniref:Syndetin C-terminal domain-containing protein n=1 Tax=Trichoplax adhaerens TaxID=10228 RepID=B3RQW0_TRIAD|nr:hypothetical protein TRIADDRAFT_54017 [Trichoplax adhaerens]EDV26774.1 hypothetical protein TRIADDRAFT_54017 [Trichoplax adhaerens]|eukprot:XP_002110770.1 hypothetical protein TRIADDRAFT_54017 [Trichoplax adhaerens]